MLCIMPEERCLQSYRKKQNGAGWRTSSYFFTQVNLIWWSIVYCRWIRIVFFRRLIIDRLECSQTGWLWFDAYYVRHCCCSFSYYTQCQTEQSLGESRPLPHSRILYSDTTIVLMLWECINDTLLLTKNKLKVVVGRSETSTLVVYILYWVKLIDIIDLSLEYRIESYDGSQVRQLLVEKLLYGSS